MAFEIKMPQLGQTSDEVRLIKWLVKEGDEVKKGQPLCEVETDKVTMELESVAEGKVEKILFGPDSEIKTGQTVAIIEEISKAGSGKESISVGLQKEKVSSKSEGLKGYENLSVMELLDKKSLEKSTGSLPVEQKKFYTAKKLKSIDIGEKRKIIEGIGTVKAQEMYRKMLEIREFEEAIRLLFLEGKMPGTIHQYIGMEACAVGVCSCLENNDVIASTHRPHGHAIARGIPLNNIMAELYGKVTGCCRGKGGSMHIGDLDKGMLPAIAIVGANIPIVGGMALAFKLKKESRVAVSFFGDGASNEGAFHEGLNMAAVYNIPAVFVCENNLYAASTPIKQTSNLENISNRVCAYGMRGDIADGMDVLDVYKKAKEAVDLARERHLPTLLELKTFRLCGHSRRDPCNYMTKEERAYWQSRDPITLYEKFILDEGIISETSVNKIKQEIKNKIESAVSFAQTSPYPAPEDTYNDLYINIEVPR